MMAMHIFHFLVSIRLDSHLSHRSQDGKEKEERAVSIQLLLKPVMLLSARWLVHISIFSRIEVVPVSMLVLRMGVLCYVARNDTENP